MADSPLKEASKRLSALRDSAVLAIVLPQESMQPQHVVKVHECLESRFFPQIDLVLHSGGGDINTAYQIAELLRTHAKKLNAIVPMYAKSAATLLTLAADQIVMGEMAELGPLDTQILERQRGSRKYNSALNPFKSLEQLQSFSLETLDMAVKLFINRSSLTVDEAIARAIEFASSISTPMYSKLDIEKLGEYSRALAVGKEYGDRLLKRYTRWSADDDGRAELLDKLVRGYPSHDYIIDFREMAELGFSVARPSDLEKPILDELAKQLIGSDGSEIFCVSEPPPPATESESEPSKER
jgi:hypothetical protein